MRFLPLVLFLFCSSLLQGQIVIGGKQFARSPTKAGAKGEWVLYEKGAPQNEGTRCWLTKRVLVELSCGNSVSLLSSARMFFTNLCSRRVSPCNASIDGFTPQPAASQAAGHLSKENG